MKTLKPGVSAAVISALVPPLLLVLSSLFPHHWTAIVGDDGQFQGHFPFGMSEPLTKTSLTFVIATSGLYWLLTYLFLESDFEELHRSRLRAGDLSQTLAKALVFFVIPLLVTIWCLAIKTGSLVQAPWGTYEGNHGPWRHLYDLRKLLYFTFELSGFSVLVSLIPVIPERKTSSLVVLAAATCCFFGLTYTHFWLID